MPAVSFGTRLRAAIKARGASQRGLAERLAISETRVSEYVHDVKLPRADMVARIAEALGVTTDALLGGGAELTPLVPRGTPAPDSYAAGHAEGARWGYIRAAKELIDRALAEQFPERRPEPAPPITAAALATVVEPPATAVRGRRAREG
jgi:transcriptional regulator with XRE-family HTH domain